MSSSRMANQAALNPFHGTEAVATASTYRRGQEICGAKERTDHWFYLVSGGARQCALLADGRRRIVDFLMPGDVFGFGESRRQQFTTEAIVDDTTVLAYPAHQVEALADTNPEISRRLRHIAMSAVMRTQARALILGHVTAREKVGCFLLEMAERTGDPDYAALPMSRYDIADYLAISVETVSRALTDLKRRSLIEFAGTHLVKLVDRTALEDWEGERDRLPSPPLAPQLRSAPALKKQPSS